MASPIIVKAKVSSSAKPKPAGSVVNGSGGGSASGTTTPRVVVRAPHVDTSMRSPRMGTSAPTTPVVRVTAKLSGVARAAGTSSKPGSVVGGGGGVRQRTASTSKPAPAAEHIVHRARTGSVYSLNAFAAHQQRPQSPVRSVVRPGQQHFQSLSPHTPHSPPASVLSIHSASTGTGSLASTSTSTSTSSPVSPRPQVLARVRVPPAREVSRERDRSRSRSASPLSDISSSSSSSSRSKASSPDAAMEAKVNRKIADLEITNASLLTINASLEALKSKHQKEIWDLRRKLRETRLALPPPVFASLKSKDKDKDKEKEVAEEEEEDVEPEPEPDPAFDRLNAMLGNMLDAAREALAAPAKTVRVLSEQEVKMWEGRRSGGGEGEEDEEQEEEREVTVLLDGPPDVDVDADASRGPG